MDSDGQERIARINRKLKEVILRHMEAPDARPSAVKGLTLVRRDETNSSERCFEKPLASVVVQGSKQSTIGMQQYVLRENQCLVSAVDMPSISYAVDPSAERPFLSLFFYLDKQIFTELISEMEPEERPAFQAGPGVSVADAEPDSRACAHHHAGASLSLAYRSAGKHVAGGVYQRFAGQSDSAGHFHHETEHCQSSAHGCPGKAGQHVHIESASPF